MKRILSTIIALFIFIILTAEVPLSFTIETLDQRQLSSTAYVEGRAVTILPNDTVILDVPIDSTYTYFEGTLTFAAGAGACKVNAWLYSPTYNTYSYDTTWVDDTTYTVDTTLIIPANYPLYQFINSGYVPAGRKLDLTHYGIMFVGDRTDYRIYSQLINLSVTDTITVYINYHWRK